MEKRLVEHVIQEANRTIDRHSVPKLQLLAHPYLHIFIITFPAAHVGVTRLAPVDATPSSLYAVVHHTFHKGFHITNARMYCNRNNILLRDNVCHQMHSRTGLSSVACTVPGICVAHDHKSSLQKGHIPALLGL